MKTGKTAGAVLIGCMLLSGCATQSAVTKDASASPAAAPQTAASMQAKTDPQSASNSVTSANALQQAATEAQTSLAAVYFGFDSSALDKTARDTLQKDFSLLNGKTVKIEGHCDERGSDEYNLALGEKRAHAAQQYLITLGFPADRLSTISYGKERPAVPGHDEASWARNRRADVAVVK